ncbi:MAG: hypothetical protein JNL13_09795 [Chitinophagaceae bacterium]|nr:hypothetical protein [Chitinophagaceae bacterium]
MKKFICLVCLLSIASYCSAQKIPSAYKQYFGNCCNLKKTSIRSFLEIDGYYVLSFIDTESNTGTVSDTNQYKIIFYENGLCVSGWAVYVKTIKDVYTEIERIINNGSKDWFYKTAAWGKYEIRNDTIVTRNIIYGTLIRPVNVWEVRYKIVNRTTIVQIDEKKLVRTGKHGVQQTEKNDAVYFQANFVPLQTIPVSDYSWLRRQKCDASD